MTCTSTMLSVLLSICSRALLLCCLMGSVVPSYVSVLFYTSKSYPKHVHSSEVQPQKWRGEQRKERWKKLPETRPRKFGECISNTVSVFFWNGVKCVICSQKQLCWFWLTCTVGFFYPLLMCEMFALLRNSVTFCSARWSFSHIDKRCNSMCFLSSLMQRFPNHGEDPRQPSLCLLEPVHFYCSALNRVLEKS